MTLAPTLRKAPWSSTAVLHCAETKALRLEELLQIYRKYNDGLNPKADGEVYRALKQESGDWM